MLIHPLAAAAAAGIGGASKPQGCGNWDSASTFLFIHRDNGDAAWEAMPA